MSPLLRMLGQTATVTRVSGGNTTDDEGNWVPGAATTTTYEARLEQTEATEIRTGRGAAVSEWRLFLPPNADIREDDSVVVASQRYEVVGKPAPEPAPRGVHHITARLKFVG